MDSDALNKLTPEQQNQLIVGIKQEAAVANLQTLISELSDKCLPKCITSPGSALSNSEKQCLQRCMDRFLDSWQVVSVSLQKRLQEESRMATQRPSTSLGEFGTPSPIFDTSSGPSFS